MRNAFDQSEAARSKLSPQAMSVEASAAEVEPVDERPVRIGWIAGRETISRLGTVLKPLAFGLMDELVELEAFLPDYADERQSLVLPMKLSRYRHPRWWQIGANPLKSLANRIRSDKIELLHALDTSVAKLTQRVAKLASVRYVISSHSLIDARRMGRLRKAAAAVLAASEPIRSELLSKRVAPDEKIILTRPGVHQVRNATCFNNPSRSAAIIAGGRPNDYLACEAVIRSFAELKARNYDCAFFILNSGRVEKRLRALTEELNLRRELTFVDFQWPSQLPGIFKASDIYISPAPKAGIDTDSLLAMAAGVPVLAAGSGASDFLIDSQTAMLFEKANSAELTVKLASLMDDRPAAGALAENALAYLKKHHRMTEMVTLLVRIYRQAVAVRRARDKTGK